MRRGRFEVVGGLRLEVGWVGVEYKAAHFRRARVISCFKVDGDADPTRN